LGGRGGRGGELEGSTRQRNLMECVKLNWNFQKGEKKPFRGEGMDIFWNYTFFDSMF